jgi:hypothetical protein
MAKRKPPQVPSNYQVFVSHATADKWVARMICEKIDAIEGASTFRDDRDIEGGDDIPEKLLEEIDRSSEMLVLLTPISISRPWVTLEIGAAWHAGKWIVPMCYHTEPDRIPPILAKRKAYNLNDFDRYVEELKRRVEEGRK